ncbi:3-hydroxyasparagine phosphotransferase [Streptomyces sp. G5(2025)]|uniref:3-hydroxyasparagine phosphotransferase n=1 Tax=Streptomyces sp. G5(2025) TaxID=3406628 RepID=UPI003C259B59
MNDEFETGLTRDDRELLSLTLEVCPGFRPAEIVYRSRTSLVFGGSLDGTEALAKIRTPDWRRQSLREIDTYDLFDEERPPVAVPRRFGSDKERAVLVLERLAGEVVAPDRFPAAPVSDADLTGVLDAVERLRHWHPEGARAWGVDYRKMLEGVHAQGVFDDAEWKATLRLLELSGEPREFGHGDLVLANVVRTDGRYVLIDWASSALYLPGLDLAQLWLLLGDVPGARARIEAEVAGRGDVREGLAPFLLNLTLLLYRERRAHQRFTDTLSQERAVRLDAAWDLCRERVGRCVEMTH